MVYFLVSMIFFLGLFLWCSLKIAQDSDDESLSNEERFQSLH